jgi:hypothetical protein
MGCNKRVLENIKLNSPFLIFIMPSLLPLYISLIFFTPKKDVAIAAAIAIAQQSSSNSIYDFEGFFLTAPPFDHGHDEDYLIETTMTDFSFFPNIADYNDNIPLDLDLDLDPHSTAIDQDPVETAFENWDVNLIANPYDTILGGSETVIVPDDHHDNGGDNIPLLPLLPVETVSSLSSSTCLSLDHDIENDPQSPPPPSSNLRPRNDGICRPGEPPMQKYEEGEWDDLMESLRLYCSGTKMPSVRTVPVCGSAIEENNRRDNLFIWYVVYARLWDSYLGEFLCLFTSGREAFARRLRIYWSYSWEINCFHREEKYPSPSPFSFLLFAPSSIFRPIRQSPKVN